MKSVVSWLPLSCDAGMKSVVSWLSLSCAAGMKFRNL